MTLRKQPAKRSPFFDGVFDRVGFTASAEVTNAITVAIQLKRGVKDIAVRAACRFYLSDDAAGDSVVGTGVTSNAAGTDGVYEPLQAGKSGFLTSESDGDIDLVITFTGGAKTVYLVIVMPDGSLSVSSAIVFA